MSDLRVRYQTIEFANFDIHLRTLRDKQQFSDNNQVAEKLGINSTTWPIFGVLWPSGVVLANFLLNYDIKGLRILEVGCGIGLSSLLLNARHADISSTDYNPAVADFLKQNTALNDGKTIPFFLTDWANACDTLGTFDLIIGSDLLYEDQHIELLSRFIEKHAKATSTIILVDPSRGRKTKFSKKMANYGFSYRHIQATAGDNMPEPYQGFILEFQRNH